MLDDLSLTHNITITSTLHIITIHANQMLQKELNNVTPDLQLLNDLESRPTPAVINSAMRQGSLLLATDCCTFVLETDLQSNLLHA